jgi:hypothetical protein
MQDPLIDSVTDGVWRELIQAQLAQDRLYFVGVFLCTDVKLFMNFLTLLHQALKVVFVKFIN